MPRLFARRSLARPAVDVAPALIGALVVSDVGGGRVTVRITEVEAYEGLEDPASHAFRGPTPRTGIMFGPPGHLYCYFSYGMHWCANVICQREGTAAAVLLRAGEVVEGVELARERRRAARPERDLARGPARLATCLGLDRASNGIDLCSPTSPVRLLRAQGSDVAVDAGPRVGISVATDRPWRFWAVGDPTVSTFRAGGKRRRAD